MANSQFQLLFLLLAVSVYQIAHGTTLCPQCQYYQLNKGITTYCTPTECDEAGVNRLKCIATSTQLTNYFTKFGLSVPTDCPEGQVCCPTMYQRFCPSVTIPTSGILIGKACTKPTDKTLDCKVCATPTCPANPTVADRFCINPDATQDNCASGLVCCENYHQFACALPNPLYCD